VFRKFAAAAAATALVFSATAAQAGTASALSIKHSPALSARASTASAHDSQIRANPLFFVLGIVGVVAVLELTGAINIFKDSPDSP
jgi:hypothetical protein